LASLTQPTTQRHAVHAEVANDLSRSRVSGPLSGHDAERALLHTSWAGVAPTTYLWGRECEQAALNEVLLDVRSGRSRVLIVQGEPGIGKTALLDDFCRRARDVVVIRGVGIESESELAFAGLHQVCSQMAQDKLELLPQSQREAIRVALGRSLGGAPSPLLLGSAMLNYFADIAAERPVIVVIDDAQWLDRATGQTLAFVARRLDVEAVGLVFALRERSEELRGLPELVLSGLAIADARHLLGSALLAPLDERIRERFITETMGNPLAILELCHTLTDLENASERRDSRGLWTRLEETFERRIDALSPAARWLSLIAAAESLGDPVLVWHAADLLGIPRSSPDELESAGLLRMGVRIAFRHPLVRSVIYQHAEPEARRRVHWALAEAIGAGFDPDRRAWHRALAARGPDEEIAAELEQSAGRAARRGGLGAAAAVVDRAVLLSEYPDRRGRRALVAAEARLDAGQSLRAEELLSIAELAPQSELEVAQREVLKARLAYVRGRGRDAPSLLLSAATRLDALGGCGTRDMFHRAMTAALLAGRLSAGTNVGDVAAAALASPTRRPRTIHDLYIRTIGAMYTDGHAAAMPLAAELVTTLRTGEFSSPDDAAVLAVSAQLGAYLWDDEAWVDLASRALQLARDLGCLDVLPMALTIRAGAHVHAGEFAAASSLVHEGRELSAATGIPAMPYPAMSLAAYGPAEPAFELIHAARQDAVRRGEGLAVMFSEMAEATLCNALGRYDQAWQIASSAYADRLLYFPYLIAELVESGVRAGRAPDAVAARADLASRAAVARTDWARGIESRSEALFSGGEHAERLYRDSIEHLRRTRMRVQLARSHLLYGEWLRREGRRVDARQQLGTAYDMFGAMSAVAFTERAKHELAATGETGRKRANADDQKDELTVRESQIARLAAVGLSNREIGQQLFISHRTVGYHLAKVFAKLGVTSRALIREDMLGDRLAEGTSL
jgi:DNA-binding CsgD family transcriptional regulator